MGRRLSDGVTARLEFDYICERGRTFGEHHLHSVMNEIISANVDISTAVPHANYAHPALTAVPKVGDSKAGRKREVDFYVESRVSDGQNICIEAKWAGSYSCNSNTILLDLCRLTLVKQSSPQTECLFVLAGGNDAVRTKLHSMPLALDRSGDKRILAAPREKKSPRTRTSSLIDSSGNSLIKPSIQNSLPIIPDTITATLLRPSLLSTPRWQTLVWRIS
jgi:hypothetical protein